MGKSKARQSFFGNTSAFGRNLPLAYGRSRQSDPILIAFSDQGSFVTSLWIVSEGILATNGADNIQSANPLDAYSTDATTGRENIFVNGFRRHDTRANFGIDVFNGDQDRDAPSTSGFFASTSIADFTTNNLAFWGTAWIILKIKKKNNEVLSPESNFTAQMDIRWGRVHRIYTSSLNANDPSTYILRSTQTSGTEGANPAWVLLDFEASKRAGGGLDYSRFDIQSFIDLATNASTTVTSVIDGTAVPRWTFNGVIDKKKSFKEWERDICLAMYALPPLPGKDGTLKVRALKSEVLTGLPVFSDNSTVSSERNILWNNGQTTLTKFRKSIFDIPNEVRVRYVEYNASTKTFIQTEGIVRDEAAQRAIGSAAGDNSLRIISKTVELVGTNSRDEAARLATLVLRNGEFAEGGLSNNLFVKFQTFYRAGADLEVGDVIQVSSALLDVNKEKYFRVININDEELQGGESGGFVFVRTVTASLHDNATYDDTAFTLSGITRITGPSSFGASAPPVTGAAITETGLFDGNKKPIAHLTFTYTEPSPLLNFKSVVVMRSSLTTPSLPYDSVTNPASDNWRFAAELEKSGAVVDYEITNDNQVFIFLSKNLAGLTSDPTTKNPDGTFKYPRVNVFLNGLIDVLPIPANPQIFLGSGIVTLKWDAYTGTNLSLFKQFRIYRNLTGAAPVSADLIATSVGTLFIDTSVASGTTYFYFIKGLSILDVEGPATAALSTTSPDTAGQDTGLPTAPILLVIRAAGSFNSNEYRWLIGIDKPGAAANWGKITQTDIQVSTDSTFATFPTDGGKNALNRSFNIAPPFTHEFQTNAPGTYYFQVRVKNSFGFSGWTTIPARKTSILDNLSADTAIPPAPDALTLKTQSTAAYLAGNEFEITFEIPSVNTASYWGYSLYVHDVATLPVATTQETGISGSIDGGKTVLTDTTKAWTVNQWAGKDLVIFDPTRGATPSFDYEGLAIVAKILSNTATTITFDLPSQRQYRTYVSAKYYIVNNNAGHHFWEKLKFTTPAIVNEGALALTEERASRKRTIKLVSGLPTVFVWVALYNLFGQGSVAAVAPTATFLGITSGEIKNAAVISSKIADAAVIASKLTENSKGFTTNIVFSATNNNTVSWTAGTITFADGSVSGSIVASNTGVMTGLTYVYYNAAISLTALQVTTDPNILAGEKIRLLAVAKNISDTTQLAFFVPAIGTLSINETIIGPNSITTPTIKADAITTDKILAGNVTAAKIFVINLAAIKFDAGALTAGTLTGLTIQTSATNPKVEITTANGLRVFNAAGTVIAQLVGTSLALNSFGPADPLVELQIGSLDNGSIVSLYAGNIAGIRKTVFKVAPTLMTVFLEGVNVGYWNSSGLLDGNSVLRLTKDGILVLKDGGTFASEPVSANLNGTFNVKGMIGFYNVTGAGGRLFINRDGTTIAKVNLTDI